MTPQAFALRAAPFLAGLLTAAYQFARANANRTPGPGLIFNAWNPANYTPKGRRHGLLGLAALAGAMIYFQLVFG